MLVLIISEPDIMAHCARPLPSGWLLGGAGRQEQVCVPPIGLQFRGPFSCFSPRNPPPPSPLARLLWHPAGKGGFWNCFRPNTLDLGILHHHHPSSSHPQSMGGPSGVLGMLMGVGGAWRTQMGPMERGIESG